MKEIIINKKNAERIMDAFKAEQGRATARIVGSFAHLETIIGMIEKRLEGIPKKALEGTTVDYTFAQKFPSAYKYRPESTHFKLVYHNGSWRVASIGRYGCPDIKGYPYTLHLSPSAKEAVLKLYE